jgi:hypothetical protein
MTRALTILTVLVLHQIAGLGCSSNVSVGEDDGIAGADLPANSATADGRWADDLLDQSSLADTMVMADLMDAGPPPDSVSVDGTDALALDVADNPWFDDILLDQTLFDAPDLTQDMTPEDIAPEVIEPEPTGECVGQSPKPWSRSMVGVGGNVTISEVMVVPPANAPTQWVELHNPFALDMDLTGWRLDGDILFEFADNTFLSPGEYLVVAADPGSLDVPEGVEVLGPWQGELLSDGATFELRSNANRLMDRLEFGPFEPWSIVAFGSGASLAKVDPVATSEWAEHWRGSALVGGTPGAANFADPLAPPVWTTLVAEDATWRYHATGEEPPAGWAMLDFDDSLWPQASAPFYAGGDGVDTLTVTARFTADNYFALYAGAADGSELTYLGRDSVGGWMSAEDFTFEVDPQDHLYVAAWETPGPDGGPQMVIGEVAVADAFVLTDPMSYEWVLGPVDGAPGGDLADPPPPLEDVQGLIATAALDALWAPPAVSADKSASPWGGQLGSAFVSDPQYIWSDTFAALSQSNTAQTYVLFRTTQPLVGTPGETELPQAGVTRYFRTTFDLPAEPETLSLWLSLLVADGALVTLNGVEVLATNLPEGPVAADTLALEVVQAPAFLAPIQLPPDLLLPGENVLAVEVHQAQAEGGKMVFAAQVQAQVWPVSSAEGESGLRFNEVAPAGSSFWLELVNSGGSAVPLDGVSVALSSGGTFVLDGGWLAPGEVLLLESSDLNVAPEVGDRVFLYGAGAEPVLDGVTITEDPRARQAGVGPWFFPGVPSPGMAHGGPEVPSIVINELMTHHAPLSDTDGEPVDSNEEWIELTNAGSDPVDLSGWSMVDGITFFFPAGTSLEAGGYLVVAKDAQALSAVHPEAAIIGNFKGRLSNAGERVALLDGCGTIVDEIRYYDGGRWPVWADGGGASLELRSPLADNRVAEAWGNGFGGEQGSWETIVVEGVLEPSSVGPDGLWQELVVGLVDDGVVLIDDVSLVEDPAGAALERIQNGSFEAGGAATWRLLGTHRHSTVVEDPDDPSNHVLKLVATGSAGHMHNHAETTLAEGATLQDGVSYKLSYRARWVAGSNQVNTRLYFNRLAHTARLDRPALQGTPGQANALLVANVGPTFGPFRHWPAVPAPNEPVTVLAEATDPDSVVAMTLWYAVDGGAWNSVEMVANGDLYQAQLPGLPGKTMVHFWVEGVDGLGAVATIPARGQDARALYRVAGNAPLLHPLPTLQIIVTPDDDAWLFAPENLMSDDRIGCTVIWQGREVYYDVGLRLKGSERGRPTTPRVGFSVRFPPDQPFRGVYETVMVDRSEGVGFGQREMLLNFMMARAGSVSAEYSDLVEVIAPRDKHTGAAELQLTRFGNLMLATQFDQGDAGRLYEYEYIYYPTTTTDGSPEGFKLPQPDKVVGSSIKDLGDSREDYRHIYLPKNHRGVDDFDDIMAFAQFFGGSGAEFNAQVGDYIDVDQWLRAFALAGLPGAIDHYGNGNGHNAVFYVRPADQRVLYFPHDLDFFPASPNNAVVAHADLKKLISDPERKRAYYSHLVDIMDSAYNADYMNHWCQQMGALLPQQNFAGHCSFIEQRIAWVMDGANDAVNKAVPPVAFAITSNDGADMTTPEEAMALVGQAGLAVATIWLESGTSPLPLTWIDAGHWSVPVALACGPNPITLVAKGEESEVVGSDAIVVVREGPACL